MAELARQLDTAVVGKHANLHCLTKADFGRQK